AAGVMFALPCVGSLSPWPHSREMGACPVFGLLAATISGKVGKNDLIRRVRMRHGPPLGPTVVTFVEKGLLLPRHNAAVDRLLHRRGARAGRQSSILRRNRPIRTLGGA